MGVLINSKKFLIHCQQCDFTWEYKGQERWACCPKCRHKTKIDNALEITNVVFVKLTCKYCGREWTYKGDKNKTTCPRCQRIHYNVKKEREILIK